MKRKITYLAIFFTFVYAFFVPLAFSDSPMDGGLTFPKDYKSFPRYLSGIQKPKHVRDLFINATGAGAKRGQDFSNGTILVMAIYNAQLDDKGNTLKGPDGKNIKDKLAKIFVMEKGDGWGQQVPSAFKTGDWIYTAFSPDGKPLKFNYIKCRGCHLPLKDKDFVLRYDEYFDKRGK